MATKVLRYFLMMAVFWQCASQNHLGKNQKLFIGQNLKLDSILKASPYWMGLSIYDLEADKSLYEFQSEKLFTPASTTKLWTYYTVKKHLKDSLPLLRWHLTQDTLFLQGVGNPSLLHPKLDDTTWLEKLPQTKFIKLIPQPSIEKFGSGWAWDDYQHAYQAERSTMPVYGNKVQLTLDSLGKPKLWPSFAFEIDSNATQKISRKLERNFYTINPTYIKATDTLLAPFIWSEHTVKKALEFVFNQPVLLSEQPLNDKIWHTIYQTNTDLTFSYLLSDSDNFIAEQLLLTTNFEQYKHFDIRDIIQETQMQLIQNSETNRWVDGSGLSRYNLFSPKSFIQLLKESYRNIDHEALFHHLPIGGQGTLRNWYFAETPFLIAKTGTLSNNHNLAGYLRTKKGNLLAFCWMNNHYMGSSYPIKALMQEVLITLRDNL